MPKPKRPITAGQVVFEIFFILSYPFIAAFTMVSTVLVWIFSLLSKIVSFLFGKK
jgi:hypothetical protein